MTTVGAARALVRRLLAATGLPDAHAASTSSAIVMAEAWGRRSHGLLRVPYYLARLQAGGYNASAQMQTVRDSGPVVAFDGEGGIGHWQVEHAATLAAQRAAIHGIAAVSVGNSGHCGALGVHLVPIVDAGLAGLLFSNGPAAMPPWGGHHAVLSTSPLAAAFPMPGGHAVVDLASTAVARGSVAARAAAGEPLPEGWAFDASGAPTTDATSALAGMLAPFGGAKGFALAFAIECLTGALVGPALSRDVADPFDLEQAGRAQGIAHLVIVIDPDAVDATGGARRRLAALADAVRDSGGRVPGAARIGPVAIDDNAELIVDPGIASELDAWANRLALGPVPPGGAEGIER